MDRLGGHGLTHKRVARIQGVQDIPFQTQLVPDVVNEWPVGLKYPGDIDFSHPSSAIAQGKMFECALHLPDQTIHLLVGSNNVGASRVAVKAQPEDIQEAAHSLAQLSIIPLEGYRTPPAELQIRSVVTTTLDQICAKEGVRDVAFVKLDIEGAELAALRGAEQLLGGQFGTPPIVAVEYSHLIPTVGGTPEDLFRLLTDRGYTAWRLAHGKDLGGNLNPIESVEAAPRHDNVVFVPPERISLVESR